MLNAETNVNSSLAVSIPPTLFVEGKFDKAILSTLFRNDNIRVEPLGHSASIRSVAEVLHREHPDYFFIVDMDHFDKKIVDAYWNQFPDPSSHNLLIWRKREIENYFIDPDFLSQSEFFAGEKDDLAKKICEYANEVIFFDIANMVIIKIRESMKENWIKKFEEPDSFKTKEHAREKLLQRKEFHEKIDGIHILLSQENISQLFDKYVEEFLGENTKPTFGIGRWTDLIQGKPLYKKIINNSGFFRQQESQKGIAFDLFIAQELIKNPAVQKPSDFIRLHDLIKKTLA